MQTIKPRAELRHRVLLTPNPSSRLCALFFQAVSCVVSLQALFKLWGSSELHPKDVLTYTELVLDSQGQLVQMNRLPGGNEVAGRGLGVGCREAVLPQVGFAGGFPRPSFVSSPRDAPQTALPVS